MNLPNRLTLLRVLLIPVFVALMMAGAPLFRVLSAAVFLLAALTDFFDGYLARKKGLVTDFGKLMDPMADKLLVMAALIGLLALGRASWLAVMLLLGREFVVSGIRLVASLKGEVIPADNLAKWKTTTQMAAILLLLIAPGRGTFLWIGKALLWISVILSVWSAVLYSLHSREVFKG